MLYSAVVAGKYVGSSLSMGRINPDILGKLRFDALDADLIDEAKRIQVASTAGFLTCINCMHKLWHRPWKSAKANEHESFVRYSPRLSVNGVAK